METGEVLPTRQRKFWEWCRVEWGYSLLFVGLTVWLFPQITNPLAPLKLQIYQQLASAFTSGLGLMMAIALGHRLLSGLPSQSRHFWLFGSSIVGLALALLVFFTVEAPLSHPIFRLLESSLFGACTVTGVLLFFLPLAGLLSLRCCIAVLGGFLGLWVPLISYLLCAGICLAAIRSANPLVLDPMLLRMDISLGFNPSEAIFAWTIDRRWVATLNIYGYPLLGLLVAGIAARLHMAGALAQTRRCIFAALVVGTLGLLCYQFVPAIGPIHAFPSLFARADSPSLTVLADLARESFLEGPTRIEGGKILPRNAMPSLHTAFTLVALAAAWSWNPKFFWICLPLGLIQIATAMTTGEHYLVDIFAAVPFSALCWWLADRGVRWTTAPCNDTLPPLKVNDPARNARTIWFFASLIGALVALIIWGSSAPIQPWIAWSLTAIVIVPPSWTSFRL